MTAIRLILGDQLNQNISSLKDYKKGDVVLMCEVFEEATYVKHHKKKIAFLFSAMRHFAQHLEELGFTVAYTKLDDPENAGSFKGEIERAIKNYSAKNIIVTFPGEYRVFEDIKSWAASLNVAVDICEDDRFLCTPLAFKTWAKGRKSLRMEFFYREMRQQYNILMDGDKPEGGAWNYDSENRKTLKSGALFVPTPLFHAPDTITKDVMDLVAHRFPVHFGDLEPFYFAVTQEQARKVLDVFIQERLPLFGDYQDAMVEGQPWFYHSHISFYLNCGLLLPLEAVRAAENAYKTGKAPLNAVEGFIRQIIGWREYVRGIYWMEMPQYADKNALEAKRDLPWFFWTGDTKMNCLKQCITETKQNAYAHHIQRLMVIGNFCLIAGIDPKLVNEWFLIVYADAYEWVEMPNVTGMVLYADNGLLASKPYAASGAYINKMSDYCKGCHYNVLEKNGESACPFNYLYWDFLIRNQDKLKSNPRLGISYKSIKDMAPEKRDAIEQDAQNFFKRHEI